MTVILNHFVRRQTVASRFSHYEPVSGNASDSWRELERLIQYHFEDESLVTPLNEDGSICKLTLPEGACGGFFSGVVLVDENTVFKTSFAAREGAVEGELPRLHTVAIGGKKAAARAVDIIVYHRDRLSEEERTYVDADGHKVTELAEWQVVSINARDTVEPEPPTPTAMARNMAASLGSPEGAGGTSRTYSAEDFMASILYWSQRAMAAES